MLLTKYPSAITIKIKANTSLTKVHNWIGRWLTVVIQSRKRMKEKKNEKENNTRNSFKCAAEWSEWLWSNARCTFFFTLNITVLCD